MVGFHHRLNGDEFEVSLGVGDGQGGLVWCSPWICKVLDTTEQLNTNSCNCISGVKKKRNNSRKIESVLPGTANKNLIVSTPFSSEILN